MVSVGADQVDKVIRVVASSPDSFEAAAQNAVAEATKTVSNLQTATVIQSDLLVWGGEVSQYRVKIEMAFQLDRRRRSPDGTETVRARRCLIIANQTLASPALEEIMAERVSVGPVEFHVLVPQSHRATVYPDPTGLIDPAIQANAVRERHLARQEAEERLNNFRHVFAHLEDVLTGEVGLSDPLAAARRVMERSSFDEIIVSTLPAGVSHWLKLDLPHRVERAFRLPVTTLVQDARFDGAGQILER